MSLPSLASVSAAAAAQQAWRFVRLLQEMVVISDSDADQVRVKHAQRCILPMAVPHATARPAPRAGATCMRALGHAPLLRAAPGTARMLGPMPFDSMRACRWRRRAGPGGLAGVRVAGCVHAWARACMRVRPCW